MNEIDRDEIFFPKTTATSHDHQVVDDRVYCVMQQDPRPLLSSPPTNEKLRRQMRGRSAALRVAVGWGGGGDAEENGKQCYVYRRIF